MDCVGKHVDCDCVDLGSSWCQNHVQDLKIF